MKKRSSGKVFINVKIKRLSIEGRKRFLWRFFEEMENDKNDVIKAHSPFVRRLNEINSADKAFLVGSGVEPDGYPAFSPEEEPGPEDWDDGESLIEYEVVGKIYRRDNFITVEYDDCGEIYGGDGVMRLTFCESEPDIVTIIRGKYHAMATTFEAGKRTMNVIPVGDNAVFGKCVVTHTVKNSLRGHKGAVYIKYNDENNGSHTEFVEYRLTLSEYGGLSPDASVIPIE